VKFAPRGRKSIRVRADIVGEPAEGYSVAWVEVDPPYVWLTGDRREVMAMREAISEPIEIRGQRESLDREVRLALPDHVWLEDPRPLKVRVQVDEVPKRGGQEQR
jgi:YbbR domain-containing protein